jgi:hypothetical protein
MSERWMGIPRFMYGFTMDQLPTIYAIFRNHLPTVLY